MAQVTYNPITQERTVEFFTGESKRALDDKMNARLGELQRQGHELVHRTRVGRNTTCPCGSGLKFKKCCINKLR